MKEFWVVYDYGMGGVWGVARARSKEAIINALPDLTVFDEKPAWISAEEEDQIRSEASFLVDQPSTYPNWVRR